MSLLLGVDVGTQSVKAILIDSSGKPLATESQELTLSTPHPNWIEQNPEDWVSATKKAISKLPEDLRREVVALSFSGQMHGLTLLDSSGNSLMPAILWCDTRTTESCETIKKTVGLERLLKTTMNPPLEGFTLPKLVWVRDHLSDVLKNARHLLLPKDYVRFRLTGELFLEYSDGAGTLMQDIAQKSWDEELLNLLGLNANLLPPLISSTDHAGNLTQEVAQECGLPPGISVYAGGADNACAAISSGVISPGAASLSIGTSGTVVAPAKIPERDPQGRIHTFNHAVSDLYYLMGVHQSSGLSLRWWRDMTGTADYKTLVAEAETIQPGSEGVLFAPWLNGERTPYMNGQLSGSFLGLASHHKKAHLTRAVLEGVALSFRHSITLMRDLNVPLNDCRLLGGGAKSDLWTQIMADTLDLSLSRLEVEEGPAYGAALIAGVGHNVFKDFSEATQSVRIKDIIHPNTETSEQMNSVFSRYDQIYSATHAL